MGKTYYDDCYIVMSEYGIQRMTKRPGKLARGERAVRIRLVMPVAAFAQPDISATINVPESAIIAPEVAVEVLSPSDEPTP